MSETPLQKGWARAGDAGRWGLVAGALSLPIVRGRWRHAALTAAALAASAGLSKGLKKLFPRLRPNGEDRQSFPSEHAAETFAAAAMLTKPIQPAGAAIAAATALSRRFADKHHLSDIAAGVVIGLGTAAAVRTLAGEATQDARR